MDTEEPPRRAPEAAARPYAPRPRRRAPWPRGGRLVLWLAAAHAAVMALLVPPWMGEDEPWHLETALWVARGERPAFDLVPPARIPAETWLAPVSHLMIQRRFPARSLAELAALQGELLRSMADARFEQRVDWAPDVRGTTSFDALHPAISAADEPALYATLLGAWLAPFRGLTLEAQLALARAPSALAYLLAVFAALRLGQRVSRDPRVAVAAGLVCALWPMHARQAAVVNTDVLGKAAASFAILCAADLLRPRATHVSRIKLLLTLTLAPFTKPTAVSAFALAPAALFGVGGRGARAGRVALVALAATAALGVVAVLALAASPTVPGGLQELAQRVKASLAPASLAELGRTFVGTFGWNQRFLPPLAYGLGAALVGAGALGLVRLAAAPRRVLARRAAPAAAVLAGVMCAVQVSLVILRGGMAGRYLFPSIAPFALLLTLGFLALAPERRRGLAAAVLVGGVLALDAVFVTFGLVGEEWLRFGS